MSAEKQLEPPQPGGLRRLFLVVSCTHVRPLEERALPRAARATGGAHGLGCAANGPKNYFFFFPPFFFAFLAAFFLATVDPPLNKVAATRLNRAAPSSGAS